MTQAIQTPGNYLSEARRRAELSQTDLAALVSRPGEALTTQTISSWECDRTAVPISRLNALREHLGINRLKLVELMAAHHKAKLLEQLKAAS